MQMVAFTGAGLGLRRDFIDTFLQADQHPDFIEVAPENWMGFGGRHAKLLAQCLEKSPLVCHGLSLSIGGPHPLNLEFVHRVRDFLKQHIDGNDSLLVTHMREIALTGVDDDVVDYILRNWNI